MLLKIVKTKKNKTLMVFSSTYLWWPNRTCWFCIYILCKAIQTFSFLPSEYWDYRRGTNLVYELLKINTGPHVYQENTLSSEIDQQLPFSKCQFFMCKILRFIMTFPYLYLFLTFTFPPLPILSRILMDSVHLKVSPRPISDFPFCVCVQIRRLR